MSVIAALGYRMLQLPDWVIFRLNVDMKLVMNCPVLDNMAHDTGKQ